MRSESLLLALAFTVACSSASTRSSSGHFAPQPPSRAFVSADDFGQFPAGWSALEALNQLRPEFLNPVPGGYGGSQVLTPTVIINGVHRGGIEMLRTLRLGEVMSMRYYRSLDATTRFGPGHSGAVIDVRLRGSGF
jgi:hypothetical protein